MPLNRTRLREYRKQIADLQRSIGFTEKWRTIAAKLLDLLSRRPNPFANLNREQQRRVIESIFRPESQRFTDEIFRIFNQILEVINTLYNDMGVDIQRDFSKIRAIEKVIRTYLGAYEEDEIDRIRREVREGLARNENYRQIKERLQRVGGAVGFYADTLARTQIKSYGRIAKAEKARISEIFFFEYVGILRDTTRPFCEALIGTVHHLSQIEKMRNGNLEPVLIHCGGWNCFHDWEPDPFSKKSTVEIAKELGQGKRRLIVYTEKDLVEIEERYKKRLKELRSNP